MTGSDERPDSVRAVFHELDDDIVQYISQLLDGVRQGDMPLEDLQEIVAGLSSGTSFCSLSDDRKTEILQSLVNGASAVSSTCAHESNDAPKDLSESSNWLQSYIQVAAGVSDDRSTEDAKENHSAKTSNKQVELLENILAQRLPHNFLAHSLEVHGSLEAAATWLVEQPDLQREVETWENKCKSQREQQAAEAKQTDHIKRKIVTEFALRPACQPHDGKNRKHQSCVKPWGHVGSEAQPQSSQARYRESMKVATKGEKYIIEKVGEDWDGGSKGKVYTKGKRGKGFH